ncbi:MAG: lipase family protein [Pseudomonadota bacterium]
MTRFAPLLVIAATSQVACPAPPPADEAPRCELGPPQVAGTAETDLLASAPARCGMPAYRWLRSDRLGEIVERGAQVDYEAAVLELTALVGDITLPRPPRYDVRVEQILYRTQDRGVLVEATALVGYPTNASAERALDMLLILHGTSGFTDGCGPSVDDEARSLVGLFASLGMVAVAPDYIGLKAMGPPTGFLHPYLVGEATAIASLDAVRAADHIVHDAQPDRCVHPRLALFGGSQGGHAALWVDRLQPYYARELTLVGGVATVPPADLLGEAERALQQTVPASANTAVMLAAGAEWYGANASLDEVFATDYVDAVPEAMAASCDPGDTVQDLTIQDLYTPALLQAAASNSLAHMAPWGCMLEVNSLLQTPVQHLTPQGDGFGLLFVLGEADALVHTPLERASFDTLCQAGMRLQYLECAGASHTQATGWSYPEILTFIDARLAGQAMDPALLCHRVTPVVCSNTPEP